jgi:hypothetical protein
MTETVTFKGVRFTLASSKGPARFVLGLNKCGSSLLNQIVEFFAAEHGLSPVNLPGVFFNSGLRVEDWADADLSEVIRPGNLYIGFRNCPPAFARDPLFARSRRVFMFRDPRDALVSLYFSDAYSHSLPGGEGEAAEAARAYFRAKRERTLATDINDYVLNEAASLDRAFMAYAEVLRSPMTLTLRYEEHVFQKKRMIAKIARHFGLPLAPEAVERLLAKVDIVPAGEDMRKFVRAVIPGDHRRKLRPETIDRLDQILRESLALYDYH